jgi:hypothetical protein
MGICWFCYWGWPKPVADIYLKALEKLNGYEAPLHYGPAHVVWDDENFDCAQVCLDDFDRYSDGFTKEEMDIVRESLVELAELPESDYEIIPDDYDDEHPELYPPTVEVVKV